MPEDKNKATNAKRRVKNPETFRQRAIKANQEDLATSKKTSMIKSVSGKVARPVKKPFKAIASTSAYKSTKKPRSIIGKVIFPTYFRKSFKELKLVTWPTLKQSRQLTFAVLIFAIVFGASIALLDLGLDKLFKNVLLK